MKEKTPQQVLDQAWEEFRRLHTEKRDIYPPQEDTCKICRDYKNHAHSPDREAIGYNEALDKLVPEFQSFLTSTLQAFIEAEIARKAIDDQISHLKELLERVKEKK